MIQIKTNQPVIGFADSRIGGRAENQDTFACADTPLGLLVTVCDGMGGGPGGKTASMTAAGAITEYLKACQESDDPREAITEAVRAANEAIHAAVEAARDTNGISPLQGMGSTVALLLIRPQSAWIGHVGDSRVYQLRGHSKAYRTTDHSRVMEMVRDRLLKNEEAARQSSMSNVITRALGHGDDPVPDVTEVPYLKGDRFVLCSDGIWGTMPEKQLLKMLTGVESPAGAVDHAVVTVDDLGVNTGGHHDNLTIAVVDTQTNSILKPTMTPLIKNILIALGAVAVLSIALNIVLGCKLHSVNKSLETYKTEQTARQDSINGVAAQTQNAVTQVQNAVTQAQNAASDAKQSASEAKNAADQAEKSKQEAKEASDKLKDNLTAVVNGLNSVKSMKTGKAKDDKVNSILRDFKKLIPEMEAAGIAEKDIKFVEDEIAKPKTKKGPKDCAGQINAIVNKINAIKASIK